MYHDSRFQNFTIRHMARIEAENPKESLAWQPFTKEVPFIKKMLDDIDGYFGYRGIGQLICDASHEFDAAYARWQTVRKFRSQEIIGSSLLSSGFEGYWVGIHDHPEEIILAEAALGQQVLDHETRSNRFNSGRRHLVDFFIHEKNIRHITQLPQLSSLFQELRIRTIQMVAQITDPKARMKNKTFQNETNTYIIGIPPITYRHDEASFVHEYSLPLSAKPKSEHTLSLTDDITNNKDGLSLIQSIGLLGHPVVRRIESIPPCMQMIHHEYYAPQHSPARIKEDFNTLVTTLALLDQYAPESVERFIDNIPPELVNKFQSSFIS